VKEIFQLYSDGPLQWFGQMTPWCKREPREMAIKVLGGDLAKRLLGVGVIWPKDSLVLIQPWHQGVFWPYPKSQKLKFQVSFWGLNIALSPNLIGSSDADFHMDYESGLNSKKTPRSFGQTTVAFSLSTGMIKKTLKATDLVDSKGNFFLKKGLSVLQ